MPLPEEPILFLKPPSDILTRTGISSIDVPKLVQFISGVMTLEPGDVIATGTPPGVGPLQRGDAVEVEIGGIGVLKNFVV